MGESEVTSLGGSRISVSFRSGVIGADFPVLLQKYKAAAHNRGVPPLLPLCLLKDASGT